MNTETSDYCKARVTFEDGTWIEAGRVEINFDVREISLTDIGKYHVDKENAKTLKEGDGIAFLPEIEQCRIFCDAGEVVLPFKKQEKDEEEVIEK